MGRLLTVGLLLGLLAGCDQGNSKGSNDKLTAKERVRWEKFRKENPDTYILTGYLAEFQGWRMCIYDNNYYNHRWGEKFDLWSGAEKDKANEYAKLLAQDKGVSAVALIDLTNKESPQVTWWYCLEGDQVKRTAKAPKKDLDESMKAYLRTVQANAEMMK